MTRSLEIVALALAVSALGVVSARAARIDGTGSVGTCKETGQIRLKPALTNTDSGPRRIKISAKTPKGGTPCTGGTDDGANVIGATFRGSGTTTMSSCAGLVGTQTNTLTIVVKWKTAKGTPKLNPSTITIRSETGGSSGDGHGSFDVTGTVTAGSFLGAAVSGHTETAQSVAEIATACDRKGVKRLTFGLNGLSMTTINSSALVEERRERSVTEDPAVIGDFPNGWRVERPSGPPTPPDESEIGEFEEQWENTRFAPVVEEDLAPGATRTVDLQLEAASGLAGRARWVAGMTRQRPARLRRRRERELTAPLDVTIFLDGSALATGTAYHFGLNRGGDFLNAQATTGGRATMSVTNTSHVTVKVKISFAATTLDTE
jgi:hypothetical protein